MFVIFGNLNFVPGRYDEWVSYYKELEKYVIKAEKNTLSYYFGVPVEYGDEKSKSPQMLAFEAYDARADLYDTHFHSKAMHDFLPKIKKTMTTGLDLTHYEDVGGFLDKADMRECGIIYDTRIKSARGKRDEVLNRFKTLSQWVEKNESGTYTFLVLKSLDNDSGVRIFERYENKSALVEHMSGQKLLETFMDSKEIIASMEGRGYSPCGFGWLHR